MVLFASAYSSYHFWFISCHFLFFRENAKALRFFALKRGGSVTIIRGCAGYSRLISAHPRFGAAQVGGQVPLLPPMSGPRA